MFLSCGACVQTTAAALKADSSLTQQVSSSLVQLGGPTRLFQKLRTAVELVSGRFALSRDRLRSLLSLTVK